MTTRTLPLPSRDPFAVWVAVPVAVLVLLALVAFLGDANRDWFVSWNQAASILPPFFWAGVTNIGSTAGAFALLAGGLAWWPRWVAAALLAAPAAVVYAQGGKAWFALARPPAVLEPGEFTVIGKALKAGSFPSGHSVTAFTLAAVVALGCIAAGRRWMAGAALAAGSLVAFSRIAVGAHWPLDVLVGAAGGWLCGALGIWWSERWRFWESDRGVRILALLMGLVAIWLFFEDLGYPEGLWAQYVLVFWGLAGAGAALVAGARWSRS